MVEIEHQLLEVALAHLAVADADGRLRNEAAQASGKHLDVLDHVVHEIDLAAATGLAKAGLAHQAVAPLGDECFDGHALGGRRGHERQVPQAAERHVERARNRRSRQGQRVDVRAQLLEPLLVADAKAMFFVDDDETEIVESDVALKQAVRTDHDVDGTRLQSLDDHPLLGGGPESGEVLDPHRPVRETVGERSGRAAGQATSSVPAPRPGGRR